MAKGKLSLFGRLMKIMNPFAIRNYSRGIGPSNVFLILTTKGRKSGKPHLTPIQFEEIDGIYYVASARGLKADWYRNILANPDVEVDVNQTNIKARAEAITDTKRIADFLELRLRRHPLMMHLLLWMEGLPLRIRHGDIETLASMKALVALHPLEPLP